MTEADTHAGRSPWYTHSTQLGDGTRIVVRGPVLVDSNGVAHNAEIKTMAMFGQDLTVHTFNQIHMWKLREGLIKARTEWMHEVEGVTE